MARAGHRMVIGHPIKPKLDWVRLNRRLNRGVERYMLERAEILQLAQTGDVGALCILKERWGLRLPRVEGRLKFTLPWMGK